MDPMTQTPISVQDALWLNMDRPNNLMIIDSIMWFRERPDWDAVAAVVQERMVDRFPVFSAKAVKKKNGHFWVTDPDFDLDNHLIRADLPAPATIDAVQAYVAAQRSKPLDKSKPLWQFHLIDDVIFPDGTSGAAVMARFHHSIADGVRLTQVFLGLCDPVEGDAAISATVGRGRVEDSTSRGPLTPVLDTLGAVTDSVQETGRATADTVKGGVDALRDSATEVVGRVVAAASDPTGTAQAIPDAVAAVPGQVSGAVKSVASSGQSMFDEALSVVGDPARLVDAFTAFAPLPDEAVNTVDSVAKLGLAGPSVDTVWSGTPGVAKTAHWVDAFPLDKVKEVGRRSRTTVNDVLLTVVAGTLQQYLHQKGEHLDEVMWMIPVSLRPFDPGMPEELGNHFALVAFEMPLNIDDPKERLREVNRRIGKIKDSQEAVVTFGVQRVISETPERLSVFLTNFFANKAVGVLTNVPGPRTQIALAGTPVDGVLGWAPSSGDQPMTICIFSYNGRVQVGFGTDAKLIPDAGRLPELFAEQARLLYRSVTGRDPQDPQDHDESPSDG